MTGSNFGKRHSDWALPALLGGIVGLGVLILGPWTASVFDAWFGPSHETWRAYAEPAAVGIIMGGLFYAGGLAVRAVLRRPERPQE